MPYIKQEARLALKNDRGPMTAGELNYLITMQINNFVRLAKNLDYQTINDVVGALEGAKLEFYRRVVSPYEDQKIKKNGDVY